jgi:hypothetical protein
MNIFVLDLDPAKAAKFHCDKHVVKMILESGQMLCTAHWTHGLRSLKKELSDFKRVRDAKAFALNNLSSELIPPWTLTHAKHPCSVWTAETQGNYDWHLDLMRELLNEYTNRYKKNHKSEAVWKWLNSKKPLTLEYYNPMTEHPQCMPDECKVLGDPVSAYRNYYRMHKYSMAKWKWSSAPAWWLHNDEKKIKNESSSS